MYEEYDRSLHSPARLKTMESPAQELDEGKLDAAIADLLSEEASLATQGEPLKRPEFPDLRSQDGLDAHATAETARLSVTLRQKWAELSGAA